ncbi:hypothetical protein [Winogradskyella sp.]|uniref:hypothetical protein n=1 Tax=Winogradskyella sp. TaxID=1883156 RepID=UPI001B21B4DA|nr:hypothetical protein [Winogradskyella sp.]MBO6880797.1 hypothetical protein [Winogradskyella sp.]
MQRYNFTNPLFLFKIESMMRRIFIVLSLLLLTTCDDGDIITVDLEFNKELDYCTNSTESFLIYDLREDPSESLSLIIPRGNDQEFPFTEATPEGDPTLFTINESSIRFLYRTYNRSLGNNELCELVPSGDLTILDNYEAASGGTVVATVTIQDDDNDGIPNIFEDRNGNGDLTDDDFDEDGIPDYQDQDDDNDNVPTEFELNDDDDDDDPTTNPLNTDNDELPDYLDTDDDGDTVPTIDEDNTDTQNPRNPANRANDENDELEFHYLNPLENTNYGPIEHIGGNIYTRNVTVEFLVTGADLEILTGTDIDFGTLTYDITIIEEDEN